MIKARSGQFQAEGVFPGQPITHNVGGLTIRQAFHKLEHGYQRQAPRGEGRLTMGRKEISERFIGVDCSQRVTHLHDDISMGKDSVSYTDDFFGNRRNW
jgi:hypothetical protein